MSNAMLEVERLDWLLSVGFDELFDYIENCLISLHSPSFGETTFLKRSLAAYVRGPLTIVVGLSKEARKNLQCEKAKRQTEATAENRRILNEFGGTRNESEADYDFLLASLYDKRILGFVNGDWKGFLESRRQQEGMDESIPYAERCAFVKRERQKQEGWETETRRERDQQIYWLQELKEFIFKGIEIDQRGFRFLHPGKSTPREIFESIGYCGPGFPEPEKFRLEVISRELKNAVPVSVGHTESYPGYVLYKFSNSHIIMAEKPFYGNATYLLNCSWNFVPVILKNTKTEVISKHRHEATRVIHDNLSTWISEIKRRLQYGWR